MARFPTRFQLILIQPNSEILLFGLSLTQASVKPLSTHANFQAVSFFHRPICEFSFVMDGLFRFHLLDLFL